VKLHILKGHGTRQRRINSVKSTCFIDIFNKVFLFLEINFLIRSVESSRDDNFGIVDFEHGDHFRLKKRTQNIRYKCISAKYTTWLLLPPLCEYCRECIMYQFM
jgi:hypothetical protein